MQSGAYCRYVHRRLSQITAAERLPTRTFAAGEYLVANGRAVGEDEVYLLQVAPRMRALGRV